MAKKATLSAMEKVKKQLEEAKPSPVKTKKAKPAVKKKETVAKVPVQDPPTQAQSQPMSPENLTRSLQSLAVLEQETVAEGYIPRGKRADFIKTTVTLPIELLAELRVFGMKRRAKKMKDTDFSALTREAITEFLNNHKDD